MDLKRFFKYWFPVIIYAALIFIFSSISQPMPSVEPFSHFDKLCHFLEYGILGFLLIRALGSSKTGRTGLSLRIAAIVLAVVYGVTDELHQYFVPGRNMEFMDILSDALGAFTGQIFFKLK